MRQPALAIWIVSGGKKVINAHAVVRLMIRFVFRLGPHVLEYRQCLRQIIPQNPIILWFCVNRIGMDRCIMVEHEKLAHTLRSADQTITKKSLV